VADVAGALLVRQRLPIAVLRTLIPAEVTALGVRLLDETRQETARACSG
jgi:hypothetical protein